MANSFPLELKNILRRAGRLRSHPLAEKAWARDLLVPQLAATAAGETKEQNALFRELDRVSRIHGFDNVIDDWEPDLAWLRGEAGYRCP